jgi:hypothetical protein
VGGRGEMATFNGRGGPIAADSVVCDASPTSEELLCVIAGVMGVCMLLSASSLLFLREGGRGGGRRGGGPTYA